MTKEELENFLNGRELFGTLDIKTLVLDAIRDMPQDRLAELFWEKLPDLNEEHLRDYLFMRRN